MLIAGPAMAGTITAPPAGFTVPSNGNPASPCCGQITITGSGYTPNANISVMICDGTSTSSSTWDPNVNCDSGTSPAAAIAASDGSVSFQAGSARAITFFDGTNPSGTFDCLYPTEADPPDGLPHWGNGSNPPCQIIITSNLTQKTNDQALESFVLPTPGTAVPETNYIILLPIGTLVLLGGGYIALRRRNRHSAGAAA
jgi:hypothetical protein